jgi:hypothetical protein
VTTALLAIAWYVPANFSSENFLFDSLSALALTIAFSGFLLLGVVLMVAWRVAGSGHERFFSRRPFEAFGGPE